MRKNSVFFLGAVAESWIAAAKAAAGSDTYAQLNLLGDATAVLSNSSKYDICQA